MNAVPKLKVLVAHNEPLIAAGLQATLLHRDEFDVSTTEPEFLAQIPAAHVDFDVDVVLADCRTGIHLARCARSGRQTAHPRIVIITRDESEASIRCAMEAGARGYLFLGATPNAVIEAIRCAAHGGIALDPFVATKMLNSLNGESITSRELQVLGLVMRGSSDKAIASGLGIALGTVKSHVKRLLAKLEANSRTEAAAIAQRRGLVATQVSGDNTFDSRETDNRRRDIDRHALRSRLKGATLTAQSIRV